MRSKEAWIGTVYRYMYIYSAATKTYLRSSMSEQHLTDLAVLSIEQDISDSLDLENVVDAFAQKHKNSRIVLKYLFTAVCVIVCFAFSSSHNTLSTSKNFLES